MKLFDAISSGKPFRLECSDTEWTQPDEEGALFCREEILHGHYEVKHEPVVYETYVESKSGTDIGYLEFFWSTELFPFIGKRVRVTVEELDE